jgi:DNA-binding response OmpR family regulator
MGEEILHILLIGQDSDELINSLSYVATSKNVRIEWITTSDLEGVTKLPGSEKSDIVILNNPLQRIDELESSIRKIHSLNNNWPVIIILPTDDDTMIEMVLKTGAKDYLVQGQIDTHILKRVFSPFIRVSSTTRTTLEQRRESKEFERLSTPPGTNITAQSFGVSSLSENASDKFSTFLQEYAQLLHESVEAQIFKVNHNISESLRLLADQFGFLKAGPRDIVLLHQNALKLALVSRPPEQAKIYAEEGRYLLLELMGHLVSYYRNYYINETRNKSSVIGREPGVN